MINYAATCGFNLGLVRLMFEGLKKQTSKDFELVLSDHYFLRHQDAVKELAAHADFPVTHVPVIPHPTLPRHYLDCSVFNQSPLFGESERFVRLSEWRLIHPTLTETLLAAPSRHLVDFHFQHAPAEAWNEDEGIINWDAVQFEDLPQTFHERTPINCYGNNSLDMTTWVEVNGFNEVAFGFYHFEDHDFAARLANSEIPCIRVGNKMFRIPHDYGANPGRCESPPERPFAAACHKCEQLIATIRAVVGEVSYFQWSEFFLLRGKDVRVVDSEFQSFIICNDCGFLFPWLTDPRGWAIYEGTDYKRSPINVEGAGRNLNTLWDEMRGQPLDLKLRVFEASWVDPYFLK